MDLALQSLPFAPWQLQHVAGLIPLRYSSSQQPCFFIARRRGAGIRCSGEGGERSQVLEEGSHGSWLQTDLPSDSYSGWPLEEFQPNGRRIAGWVKIGGAILLVVGFALGARSVFTRKDSINELAVPLPVKEQIVSLSKPSESVEMPHSHDWHGSNSISTPLGNGQEQLKIQGKEPHAAVTEMHHADITSGQVPFSKEDVEDSNEKQISSDISLSAATALSPMESVDRKEELPPGASAADLTATLSPSEDARQEKSFAIESFVDGMQIAMKATDEVCVFPVVSNIVVDGENIAPEVFFTYPDTSATTLSGVASDVTSAKNDEMSGLLPEENVNFEGGHRNDQHFDSHVSNGVNLESAAEDNLPVPEDVTEMNEHCMPDSLHADGSVQHTMSDLVDFSSSFKENDLEKKSGQRHDWDERNADFEPFASALESERWHFSSFGLPAPSIPPAALQKPLGRIVVPAPVDHMQEQALAALQASKVIEAGVEAGDICTRREYARWLMAASTTLSRSPAHKVFPAMYIENASKLAYEDVLPEDSDFPFIQGLAEAGLITSRLLDGNDDSVFSPDSPLTRQDLITWKLAVEKKPLPVGITSVRKETLQEISGFIDIDKIHPNAWPSLAADLSAGERSIVLLAFGYTRRFQPEKPVTKAHAAIALATGDAWELVSEELARLEAESIAEAAVVAELALETKAQQEVAAAFNELLEAEREKRQAAERLAEITRADLEKLKAEREDEKYSLLKERAALDSEKEFFSALRHEVEEQALAVSSTKLEVALKKQEVEKLHVEAEEERGKLSRVRSEIEIEKNALSLARVWAEDEARKALAHAKLLEQARKRWENQGVQVQVGKELDEANIPGPSWHYSGVFQVQNSPMKGLVTKSRDFGKIVMDAFFRFLQFIQFVFLAIRNRANELLGEVSENVHEARMKCANFSIKTARGLQNSVSSSILGVSSGVREGSRKMVDEWKEGAERLAQKLKLS